MPRPWWSGWTKTPPTLVADESQKADDAPIGLVNSRLGDWEPMLGDLGSLGRKKPLCEERVGDQRCPVPNIEQFIEVIIRVRADHLPSTICIHAAPQPHITALMGC
jgi:hypothetical protein